MRLISTFFLSFFFSIVIAQDYSVLMERHSNIYDIKKEFNLQWKGKAYERGKGWKQFKRWEAFWEPRLAPSGNFTDPSLTYNEITNYISSHKQAKSVVGSWTSIGPSVIPQGGGAGRLNFITFHPSSATSIWVGAAAGGLWKSTNTGSGWSTNTDLLATLGMADMVIDPVDNNIMYLATGDVDASDTYSVGVLKSTDAGQTWNTTGLNWTVQQNFIVCKIVISPANHNILFAATENGLYKTIDGAFSWQKISNGNFKDIKFKPGDPNIIYVASTNNLFKSTNGGLTFSNANVGFTSTSIQRISIAVTLANPEYLYVLAVNNGDYSFAGLYLSENSGVSFTLKSSTPNILTWDASGNGSGGQGWYDLALAASPTNASIIFVGGINVWKSSNKGTSWNCVGHWYGQNGIPYVHADIHDIKFSPYNASTVYASTDGGLFRSTNNGSTWADLSSGLAITQIYRIGVDPNDNTKFLAGNQDNGTNRYLNGVWKQVLGGDGMDCITRGNTMFGSLYYGDISRSTDGGNNFSVISSQITSSESGAWVTPIVMHPTSIQTVYAGYNNVWKSTNNGSNWSKISNFQVVADGDKINVLSIAPSDANFIYFSKNTAIYRTTTGGAGNSWGIINGSLPSLNITSITIDPVNPNRVWVTLSGYSAGLKVFHSSDGGTVWTNVSGTLPNVPVNCSVYQNGTSDALYIGTDMGVFYKNNDMSDWILFNGGLPFVIVNDLEIVYSTNLLRAATYGRGAWETPLFDYANRLPLVNFIANKTAGCKGTTISFTDSTLFNPISWQWEFTGGTPSVSTDQNPVILYDTPGVYPVKLTASNTNGQSNTLKNNYISIRTNSVPFTEDFEQSSISYNRFSIVKNIKSDVFISATDLINLTHFMVLSGSIGYIDYSAPTAGNAFSINPNYFSSISLCIDASNVQALMLQFDFKQLYEIQNVYTNFRVTVNGVQIAGIFQPTGATTAWHTEYIDLNSFAGTELEIAFEANNRSIYNHLLQDRGNATLIDNINITEINSISENNANSENIIISPNPSTGDFSIISVTPFKNAEVKIVNSLGKITHISSHKDNKMFTVDSSKWKAGIYYVFISEKNKTIVRKFVKLT